MHSGGRAPNEPTGTAAPRQKPCDAGERDRYVYVNMERLEPEDLR